VGSVFSGDTALNSKASFRDCILGETKLGQSRASSNLDLCSHNVDSSNLLCSRTVSVDVVRVYCIRTSDGVLHLDTRVNLNEVMPAHLVD